MRTFSLLLLAVLALAAGDAPGRPAPAPAAGAPARVALVIGNAAYAHAPLANATHDAEDIAAELGRAGFRVILRRDATLKDMHLALREFGDALTRNATGVVFFSGHGLQVRGRNYLIPVDADIAREDEVAFAAMDLGAVMEKLDSARNPTNVVILDACRNNPFEKRFQVAQKGLAQVEAPPGTLIAFATAPGSVAADGRGRNGLYTSHLLAAMKKPGEPIEEVLKTVRAGVRKASANLQVPWESTSLETRFFFRAPPPPAPVTRSLAPAPARTVPAGTPPAYVPKDRWVYRVKNQLDGSEERRTLTVKDVKGDEVHWEGGAVSDLIGNFTRSKSGAHWHTFAPSNQMYVFPLRQAASYDLAFVQDAGEGRIYDAKVTLKVAGEEDVQVPAGRFRTLKLERRIEWKRRDKESDAGTTVWTSWYSGAAKRHVAAEQTRVLRSGKMTMNERWELEEMRLQ